MKATFDQILLTPRFGRLPGHFYSRILPTPLPAPYLMAWNTELAHEMGFESMAEQQPNLTDYLCGNRLPQGSEPIASIYSGHQFGVNAGQLGDGRAILIAEYLAPNGRHWEMQLKGAGPTPYSRRADGRAVLRSSIREYLCSEAMHGLGIATTRALGMAGSEQSVWREKLETAAVVLRVAPSFVRFGHFEYHRQNPDSLQTLADWVIQSHYPDCALASNPYVALLESVVERTALMIAKWQAVGFCHGVMNSDNMSILGLTLDYGPFGFMDSFDAGHICNHSDSAGRYAYQQQPEIGLWNLHVLAQTLLPLMDKESALHALQSYQGQFENHFANLLRQKLGLLHWQEDDWNLITRLFELMHHSHCDWTYFWRNLPTSGSQLRNHFQDRATFDIWFANYQTRLSTEARNPLERQAAMNRVNPKYVLRNYLAEIAIRKARDEGDFKEIKALQQCLMHPFDEQTNFEHYAELPPEWAAQIGVSCSS
ncbi:protein adenylyltransferase SelO [Iodobacter ciconiae]|uniref:Protein nucleotidyltransferase YdiU n=1 Tax=Iodobacter ciconiae TaxID=2496266 RepID=A0A3S8ZRF9_9NEIS|nr:YdiU family protein [Iodobacter ciconiae]AZN36058.1 YdiU family protein [Iodobacter ciconiae]